MTPSYSTDSENSLAPSYNTHSENVSGVLPSYSSAPSSIDYTSEECEAPMLTYSPLPASVSSSDVQGIVNTAEPLFYTSSAASSIDYTSENVSEAPVMLMYSSSPASGSFVNGQITVSTAPFYSPTPAADSSAATGSMSLADREALSYAAVPSSTATENKKVLSYSLIPYPAGTENGEAPFYSSGPAYYGDGSCSKGPSYVAVARSDSENTEALFYSSVPCNDNMEADNADVPFYTATPPDTDIDNQESPFYTLAASAGTMVPSYNLTNSLANTESSGTSSQTMSQANYDGTFDPVERDVIEMSAWLSAWTIETANNATTETDPRWYLLDNPPKDIVKGSDDWFHYTMYDCSTQTYYFPNGETQFTRIPSHDLTGSSNTENYADSSAPSYTPTSSYDGTMLNPKSSSSAESTSAGLLDLPSPTITSTMNEWRRLSDMLVQQVLSLCATLDLCRFRAVCKRWNSLICAPECGKFLCFRNANEDARYIIGRCFHQHFETSLTDIDGSTLKYIKVVGWKIFDLNDRRWYTWKGPLLSTYSNDHPLVSDEDLIVLCGTTTMAAANDHPLASDEGLVVCCSVLAGTATISEIVITNPIVMTKMVLPMPVAWNNLYLSSFLVNLAVDSISQAYKIFLINRYEDPFMCVFASTTNQWRISSNPPVLRLHDGAGAQAHSVIFQGQLYVLFKTYRVPGSNEGWPFKFWLHRYTFLEDFWTDCGVDFPEWPDNGIDRKELVVSRNRLFVVSGHTLHLETREGSIRMLDPLSVFEILLADGTFITESHLAEPSFDAQELEVDGPTDEFFDAKLGEQVAVRSFVFNQAFGFGNSIMLTYRWLGFSIVYNVETRLWELLPTDPTVELYGNVMPLRPPRTFGKPIAGELVALNDS
ncbi:uncharacterized protein [Physcomitrium patens]|uniref:F-box domain-containing protein n=2 Tax=Physcomitrium patens TaxID=3218 RepID=A0A2K1KZJ0_PHYPA|nr:uncharacterized protein LOC112275767 [Physcomitrium patens]PNR59191.1 hypothetical protein PHYPA_001982 [Physcomitrium patens]|eukprot:XP_024362164.1 uncharacterized protein LOC112275767 [Physcomitrella patens]